MLVVETIARIRREYFVHRKSIKEIVRTVKVSRNTVRKAPAMANGRCRMHGGRSPGAPCGPRNGNYRSGYWTMEAIETRRIIRALIRIARQELSEL